MQAAQVTFSKIVQSELSTLLSEGVERNDAVQRLLRRIVQDSIEPAEMDVQKVMDNFKLSREDATRALIVKQELGK
jgi:NACalpha-BTF3-like transcription factor